MGLGIEDLLWHGFPGEAEIADHGDHAKTDAAAGREMERSLVAVVVFEAEEFVGWLVRKIAGRDDVRDG